MRLRVATVGACLLLGTGRANAQIVNTLRAWDDNEPGWSGELAGSIALAQGNTEYFEFGLSGAAQYLTDGHRLGSLASVSRRTASGIEIAETMLLHLRHDYRLARVVYSHAFVQAQRNPLQRLESRFLLGLGARFDVLQTEAWEGAIGSAYMRERENLTDDDTGSTGYDRADFFVSDLGRLGDHLLVDLYGFYLPLITDFANARATGGSNLDVTLVGELTLEVSVTLTIRGRRPGSRKTTSGCGRVFDFVSELAGNRRRVELCRVIRAVGGNGLSSCSRRIRIRSREVDEVLPVFL